MRVLVTGGAGFIGYHAASGLRKRGDTVALLDNFNDFYDPERKRRNVRDLQAAGAAELFAVDILDRDGLRGAFERFRPEAVVHLAAWAGVRPSFEKAELYCQVNVTGTVNLLETARAYEVERFLFASSSSVYGGNTKLPFAEDDPVNLPISPYAATKRAGELVCHTYAHAYGLHVACLRFFTVYGPRQRPEMAIHKFARRIWGGEELPLYGDGGSRRDYTYVDDIVAGILGALDLNARYEILNLGGGHMTTLAELVAHLERALGRKARLCFLPPQTGDMEVTSADISRARGRIGYAPSTGIEEGIRRFADWFMENAG
jgi:UDP-glucuronate 4-epimerase